jgi:hypothetical protein
VSFISPTTYNALFGAGATSLLDTPFLKVKCELEPVLTKWGNGYLLRIEPSGSYAKGTAVQGGSDVDVFCSVSSTVPDTLSEIYEKLHNSLVAANYKVKKQNVSLGIEVKGLKVDVTPGRRRDSIGNDHSLYSTKRSSWIQTDIAKQISFVRNSGRIDEIRWLKEWRNFQSLDWPSFHLELFAIESLSGRPRGTLRDNILHVLLQIAGGNLGRVLRDPANSNNNLSNEINSANKLQIEIAAAQKAREFFI